MLVLAMAIPITASGASKIGDVNGDNNLSIADVTALIDFLLYGAETPEPDVNIVDLGLPSGTLWATCNVGATNPEDAGDYFAWGETVPNKENYAWTTTAWVYYENGALRFSKYNTSDQYGEIDNKTELDPEDDAAYVNWGPEWRMPSAEQVNELLTQCTWTWTDVNGVNGRMLTGLNGNTMFLPASGQRSGANTSSVGTNGSYWTRDLYATTTVNPMNAFKLYFSKTMKQRSSGARNQGCTVRPVYASTEVPTSISERADVNGDNKVSIADVTALIDLLLYGGETPEPEYYVDLGLPSGTLWATRNVGAEKPEKYGDYFAWGEVEPKDYYHGSTYKWNDSETGTMHMSKYCTKEANGVVDNKIVLDPEDDAACVNYPDGQMPSQEQIEELIANCTWEWSQLNGMSGLLVTGPNGNTMFLPAAGYRLQSTVYNAGTQCNYWLNSIQEVAPLNAWKIYATSSTFEINGSSRAIGYTVRAVRAPQQ